MMHDIVTKYEIVSFSKNYVGVHTRGGICNNILGPSGRQYTVHVKLHIV